MKTGRPSYRGGPFYHVMPAPANNPGPEPADQVAPPTNPNDGPRLRSASSSFRCASTMAKSRAFDSLNSAAEASASRYNFRHFSDRSHVAR